MLLTAWLYCALKRDREDGPGAAQVGPRGSDAFFGLAMSAVVFAGRWPFLFYRTYFNPDESQQIAGAITLAHRHWFWAAVDGHTAGPMDFYYLCLPSLWGGAVDYTTARASGLALICGTLFFVYKLFRFYTPVAVARVAIFPLVLFFTWVTDDDFVEISTEHMPVFLISAGSYFFLRPIFRGADSRARARSWFLAGLAFGLAPWAKLQASVAVLLALGAAIGWGVAKLRPFSRRNVFRTALPFIFGLSLPTLFFGGVIISLGQEQTFYQSYLAANLDYTYRGTAKFYLLSELWFFACESGFFPILFLGAGISTIVAVWRSRSQQVPVDSALKWFFGYAGAAFLTVISPGRPFLHYLLFMVPGLGLLAGAAWVQTLKIQKKSSQNPPSGCAASRPALPSGSLFLVLWFFAFFAVRSLFPVPFRGVLSAEWTRPASRLASVAARYLYPGESVALWGWRPDVYVELQAPQGVRDAHTQREIEDTPFRPYYRQRYLADLTQNQSVAFIDVVSCKAFVFLDRQRFGFETFPELRAYVAAHYSLIDDSALGRIFIRNDRASVHPR